LILALKSRINDMLPEQKPGVSCDIASSRKQKQGESVSSMTWKNEYPTVLR